MELRAIGQQRHWEEAVAEVLRILVVNDVVEEALEGCVLGHLLLDQLLVMVEFFHAPRLKLTEELGGGKLAISLGDSVEGIGHSQSLSHG